MNDFCADFFELGDRIYIEDFTKYMYESGVYVPVFFILLALTLLVTLAYYKIDNIKWAYTKIWFSIVVVLSAIVGGIGVLVARGAVSSYLYNNNLQDVEVPSSGYITFFFITFLWSLVLCFAFSCGLKFISKNSIRIPF